jgi:ABC-2 type transport system ATP-binding protein
MEKGKIIREGTPQELKDCCGGENQVKMRLTDRAQTSRAAELLSEIAQGKVNQNDDMGEISFPALEGTSVLADIVRRLDENGIELAELGLTQPTLDDVFLSITGHTAEEEADKDQ